jgi:hypothetical protein
MDESYSTHEEILNTYGILVGKSERKSLFYVLGRII